MRNDDFMRIEDGKPMEEEEGETREEEVDKKTLEDMVRKVKKVLSGTQNRSPPIPNNISYRFIKMIKDTILGKRLLEEVASNLITGLIPKEW